MSPDEFCSVSYINCWLKCLCYKGDNVKTSCLQLVALPHKFSQNLVAGKLH